MHVGELISMSHVQGHMKQLSAKGWRCSSGVKCLSRVCETLHSLSRTANMEGNKKLKWEEQQGVGWELSLTVFERQW